MNYPGITPGYVPLASVDFYHLIFNYFIMNELYKPFRVGIKILFLITGLIVFFLQNRVSAQQTVESADPPKILEFLGNQPMTRVGRPFEVLASVSNPAKDAIHVTATLKWPEGMHLEGEAARPINLSPGEKITLRWTIFGEKPLYEELVLEVSDKQAILAAARFPVRFLPEMEETKLAYIPDVTPVKKNSNYWLGHTIVPYGKLIHMKGGLMW
jgi:hypothetical protein